MVTRTAKSDTETGTDITPARDLRDAVETLIMLRGRQNVDPQRVREQTDTLSRLMGDHPDASYGVEGIPPKGAGWWLTTLIGADQDISGKVAVRVVTRDIKERMRFRG